MIAIKNENGIKEYHITEIHDAKQIKEVGEKFIVVFYEGCLECILINEENGEDFFTKVREYCDNMEIIAPYRQFLFASKDLLP